MKKVFILLIFSINVVSFSFSQTTNLWNVNNTSGWIEAINGIRNGGNDKEYTINVSNNISIPASNENTFGNNTGIKVMLEGRSTLSPSNNGSLLIIGNNQTIIVKDITLRGRDANSNALVVIGENGILRMEGNSVVTGNTTNNNGSGVQVNGGTFIMKDNSSVSSNTTSNDGGGVYIGAFYFMNYNDFSERYTKGNFTMQDNALVTGNSARDNGGGVLINDGIFTIEDNASIINNTAISGGGVFIGMLRPGYGYLEGGEFIMKDNTSIRDNICRSTRGSNMGGGVYNHGTFTMKDNASISGNIINTGSTFFTGGGGVYNRGTFTMQDNTSIFSNTTEGANGGGGMFNSGIFIMKDSSKINNNTSNSCGGGVYLVGGSFTMQENSNISNNFAYYGGGVYVYRHHNSYSESVFTMQGNATITGNNTYYGGGVYVCSGTTFFMKDKAIISNNSAISGGGGVFLNNRNEYPRYNTTFIMQDNTQILGNKATYYGGGGLYIDRGGEYIIFNKTGGSIYGEDAEQNLRNSVTSRLGHAIYNVEINGWRNVTAGPSQNPDSYGFWLNDGDIIFFPTDFIGTWKRNNYDNLLYLSENIISSSSGNNLWLLDSINGNSYTFKRSDANNMFTINIRLDGRNIIISGDSGNGQDNWNGTWIKQR